MKVIPLRFGTTEKLSRRLPILPTHASPQKL
jgi:hypothetical protein